MSLRRLLIVCVSLAGCGAFANVDAESGGGSSATPAPTTDADVANPSPSYESKYATEMRLSGAGENTPEADARPGEYYFMQAVLAFQKKEYSFAIQMYQVAASWAFKPAEYNLGVIYARGQGVPADLPRGMAWMMLAAERGEQRYVDARDAVNSALTKEQAEQANAIWKDLKPAYGDQVALHRARARWAEVRSHITGSRVGSVGHLTVGMPGEGTGDPSPAKHLGQGKGPARSTGTTPGEIAGAQGIDGSIAYRQLLESDDPYDPKFERLATGIATVGEPTAVKSDDAKTNNPDPAKHDP